MFSEDKYIIVPKSLIDDNKNYIEEILGKIETPLKEAIIAIYADEKQLRYMADKLGFSKSGLERQINKAIEKALN